MKGCHVIRYRAWFVFVCVIVRLRVQLRFIVGPRVRAIIGVRGIVGVRVRVLVGSGSCYSRSRVGKTRLSVYLPLMSSQIQ